jgi:hypothetical protein
MNNEIIEKLSPYRYYLITVSILIVIKFVFMPIIQWQNSLLADIALLKNKSSKIELLLNNQHETEQLLSTYTAVLKPMANIFNEKRPESDFKLAQQKWLESLMEKHGIAIKNTSWQLVSTIESPKVKQFQLKVNFSGKTEDLRRIMQSLESQTPLVYVNDFLINIKKQSKTRLGSVSGSLTLHFYMKNNDNTVGEKQ